MYIQKRYAFVDVVRWTRYETLRFAIIAFVPALLFQTFGLQWLQLPWTPIAVIGTAVAFVIGFQNNAAYGRIWEARKIWGGIVNYSRTWTMMVQDMVTNEHASSPVPEEELKTHIKTLVHRHIAWMTALRYAMREKRTWEVFLEEKTAQNWEKMIYIPERKVALEEALTPYLSKDDYNFVFSKKNKSAAVLTLQSRHLRTLKEKGLIWEFSFLKLESLLEELFNLQGKSERIKNFPYPRQYATIAHEFIWMFILLLPLAVIPEFAKIGVRLESVYPDAACYFVWLSVPFSVSISWIFHTMEKIGRVGENPFEGTGNDVPISTISRGIEKDIRQMIGEPDSAIPEPFPVNHNVHM